MLLDNYRPEPRCASENFEEIYEMRPEEFVASREMTCFLQIFRSDCFDGKIMFPSDIRQRLTHRSSSACFRIFQSFADCRQCSLMDFLLQVDFIDQMFKVGREIQVACLRSLTLGQSQAAA